MKLVAKLGSAQVPMQIDVGFGDAVTPPAITQAFPSLLGLDAPRLRMYPPETVVVEKLEAAVRLGMTNSRMKDYYDLLTIFRMHELADREVAHAIDATFRRRQTDIPVQCPPGLSDAFGAHDSPQRLWREFLRRLRIDNVPEDFSEVVRQVRSRAWPIMVEAHRLGEA